jgi:hypothetical protein
MDWLIDVIVKICEYWIFGERQNMWILNFWRKTKYVNIEFLEKDKNMWILNFWRKAKYMNIEFLEKDKICEYWIFGERQNIWILNFWRKAKFCMRLTCYLKYSALCVLLIAKKMIQLIDLPSGSQGGVSETKIIALNYNEWWEMKLHC